MLARVESCGLNGLNGFSVVIEADVSGGVPGVCGKAGASLARVLCCGGGEYSATRGRRIQLVPNGALFGAVPEAASKRERHNLF